MRPYIALVLGCLLLGGCGNELAGPDPVPSPTPAPTPVPIPTPAPTPAATAISGHWHSEARAWDIQLEQNGSTLRGRLVGFKNAQFTNPEHPDLQITGTVTGTNTIDFKADAYALRFSGTAEGPGRMTGSLYDCVNICRSYGEILVKR